MRLDDAGDGQVDRADGREHGEVVGGPSLPGERHLRPERTRELDRRRRSRAAPRCRAVATAVEQRGISVGDADRDGRERRSQAIRAGYGARW